MKGKRREKNSSLKKYIVAARYDGMELEQYLKEVMSVSARQRQKLFFSRGVYVNGKLTAKGFPAQKATKGKQWNGTEYKGRETITDFLENKYKPHDGIDLVVAVAMPYGVEVEEIYKYEVVATARAKVRQLESKYPRAKYGVISKGVY